jgi:hypothetical protein
MDTFAELREMPKKNESAVLFCPFCRECFEGEEVCPDHELALVPLEKLPPRPEDAAGPPKPDEVLPVFELGYGRGLAMLGAFVAIVAFFLPLLTRLGDGHVVTFNAAQMAMTVAPNLWSIPFAAVVVLAILFRRRTLAGMRGARLVVPLMGTFPAVSGGYTVLRALRTTEELVRERGVPIVVEVEWGLWVVIAASLMIMIGGALLGVERRREVLPHGAAPDRADGGIVVDDDE